MSDQGAPWACEAYGPEGVEVGAVCFFGHGQQVCASEAVCHERMADERRRVFQRMSELAAAGDETAAFLAEEFTHPEQLLGGGEEPDDRGV